MNKTNMLYFEHDDVLHLAISDEPEAGSVEVSPGITAELNAKGDLIGIEILRASHFVRDSVMESVQARVLGLARAATKPLTVSKRVLTAAKGTRRMADKVAEKPATYAKE